MPRDNRCADMTHVYLYVCCSDCGNVCCVAEFVFTVCIVRRAAVGARVWKV